MNLPNLGVVFVTGWRWSKLKKQNQRFARRRMKQKEKEALCYNDDQ